MHHREWQGVSPGWFVMRKITAHCWKLIFAGWDDNELVAAGSGDWQGDRIIPFLLIVPQSGVQLHPRLTLGKPPTNAAPNEFWQICGFGLQHYNSNTASKVGTTMESGNELSLSDQTVQYTEINRTVSGSVEDWREEPVISWELQYQSALDYVTDSQTLNFVKFVVEKSFSKFGSRKEGMFERC